MIASHDPLSDELTIASLRFLSRLTKRPSPGREDVLSGPLRGELLGTDQLAEKARSVAREQRLAEKARGREAAPLLVRLTETRRILRRTHALLAGRAESDVDVGPAGEWLLDNYYVVQEHIREVIEALPRSFYRELPELEAGLLAGYPRVYELAITLISHSEGRVDVDNLELFVSAFQDVSPLSIGELWALPAMLRLALIESVRRMALRTAQRMHEIERADEWAARLETALGEGASAHAVALRRVRALASAAHTRVRIAPDAETATHAGFLSAARTDRTVDQ